MSNNESRGPLSTPHNTIDACTHFTKSSFASAVHRNSPQINERSMTDLYPKGPNQESMYRVEGEVKVKCVEVNWYGGKTWTMRIGRAY